MKKLIYGLGEFSDIIYNKIKKENIIIDGFCVDKKYYKKNIKKRDMQIYFYEELNKNEEVEFYIAVIGKNSMFEERKMVFEKLLSDNFKILNFISSYAIVETNNIGIGNIIMENTYIDETTKIGDGNIIWQNVVMPHHNIVGSFNNISPSVSFSGYSVVDNQCFLGNNSSLNNGVHIEDKSLIGAEVFAAHDVYKESVLVSERAYILKNRKSWEFK